MQDVYSLRCTPQVHGPAVEALEYVERIIGTEINSATDNPLIFDDGAGGYVSISGGHFHGQYVAQAMDVLAIAMADLGSISERRLARLVDPTMSYGLPRNLLAGKRGLNTGFATVQCSMSALVMENRGLVDAGLGRFHPRQVQCRGPRLELHLVRPQGAHDRRERRADRRGRIADGRPGPLPRRGRWPGTIPSAGARRAALEAIRAVIPPALDGDRWYATEMNQALDLVRSGTIVEAVERAVGGLE